MDNAKRMREERKYGKAEIDAPNTGSVERNMGMPGRKMSGSFERKINSVERNVGSARSVRKPAPVP
jgi:hypothetical protein